MLRSISNILVLLRRIIRAIAEHRRGNGYKEACHHGHIPEWCVAEAAFRIAIAVCPACDPCEHQTMTPEACHAIAYVLLDCRYASCLACGKQRLCFYYIPQETGDAAFEFSWGLGAPTEEDEKAFEADKHLMLTLGIDAEKNKKVILTQGE